MKNKFLSISLGVIILFSFLYFQFISQKVFTAESKITHDKAKEIIGIKMSLKNLRPIRQIPNWRLDSTGFKIVVVTSLDCSNCENLVKILSKEIALNSYSNLIVTVPLIQESIALEKYKNMNYPIYSIDFNDVVQKVKYVPAYLFLDDQNVVIDVAYGGIIVKEDLDFIIAGFYKAI